MPPWQQRDLYLRSRLHRVALHLQVQVTAHQSQRRLKPLGLHEDHHHLFSRLDGIGMALELLPKAQRRVLLQSGWAESTLMRRKRALPYSVWFTNSV